MADVFLSYASTDGNTARRVATVLEAAGYIVWWDRHLLAGDSYQQAIQAELAAAGAVVVLWSRASTTSEWVYSEARRGHQRSALVQVRSRDLGVDDLPAPFDAMHCPFVDDHDSLLRAVGRLVEPSRPGAEIAVTSRERKAVSVLVAHFASNAQLDPEDVAQHMTPYHSECQRIAERFGGTVERLAGNAVMATFGAPAAHEDDPERAVRAAIEVCSWVQANDGEVSVQIGIASGEAVVSRSTRTDLGESMLSGEVVSTAARLQAAAPRGGVLVDRHTQVATGATIDYEPQKKGDHWLVVGGRGSVGEDLADSSHPMIGRADELAQLERSFLRSVRDASVQLVTVVAEPGLGKSRLVQAFREWADDRDELITWRQGRCPPYGDSIAFAALADIINAQAGILDSDPVEIAQRKLEEMVDPLVAGTDLEAQASWLTLRLAPLVGLPGPGAPQAELFTAWTGLLQAVAANGPLVLVIDDLHDADQAMLAFLSHLVEWTTDVPLMIVATARPELYDAAPTWAAGQRNASTLTLAPLTDAETSELVRSLFGGRHPPPGLEAVVTTRAAGNPLYAREYVAIVTDRAESEREEPPELLSLPVSVRAVIAARLDLLPTDSKALLQAASVVGHTFWSGVVASVTRTSDRVAQQRLHDSARRDYLRRSRSSRIAGQHEYAFAHALIADVAYSQLPRPDRSRYHQAVADWLAARIGQPDASADAALVARHYAMAHALAAQQQADPATVSRLAAAAAGWHTHAAEHARRTDVVTALAHAEAAVDHTQDDDPVLANRLALLGALLQYNGRDGEAATTYARAGDLAERSGDTRLACHARIKQSDNLRWMGRGDEADALLDDAIANLASLGPTEELVRAHLSRAEAHTFDGRTADAVRCCDLAMETIATLDHPDHRLEIWTHSLRGQAFVYSGDPRAQTNLLRALELADANHERGELNVLESLLGQWSLLSDSPEEARTHYVTAVRAAEQTGQRASHLYACAVLAEVSAISGRVEEAVAICDRAASADESVDSARCWTVFQIVRTWLHLICDELDSATATLDRTLADARDDGGELLAVCLLVAAECDLGRTGGEGRAERMTELVSLAKDPETYFLFAPYLSRLVRVLVAAGQIALAERVVDGAPSAALLHHLNLAAARALIAGATDRPDVAVALHERAALGWGEYGYPLEQAHALMGAAACRVALGLPAREPLLAARAIVEGIGAKALLSEIDRLLSD